MVVRGWRDKEKMNCSLDIEFQVFYKIKKFWRSVVQAGAYS